MKTNRIFLLTLLLILVFSLSIQADSYTIKWKPYLGTLNYTFENSMDFSMDIAPQQTMNWQMLQTMVMEQEMQKEEDGNISSIVTIIDYDHEIQGVSFSEEEKKELDETKQALLGKVFRIKMSPQGEILSFNLPEGFDSMGNTLNYNFAAFFPKEPVKIGDSWDHNLTVKLPLEDDLGEMPMTMNFKYRLIGTEKIQGYDCLVISVSGNMEVSFSSPLGEEGQEMNMNFLMDLNGYFYFAHEEGILVKSTMSGDMDGVMTVPVPTNSEQTEFQNQDFNMKMKFDSLMELNGQK